MTAFCDFRDLTSSLKPSISVSSLSILVLAAAIRPSFSARGFWDSTSGVLSFIVLLRVLSSSLVLLNSSLVLPFSFFNPSISALKSEQSFSPFLFFKSRTSRSNSVFSNKAFLRSFCSKSSCSIACFSPYSASPKLFASVLRSSNRVIFAFSRSTISSSALCKLSGTCFLFASASSR